MTLDQLASHAAGPSLSRRRFLQAGAAAGGGLMLSLNLLLPNGAAEAADEGFAPNAFIRIGSDGQIVLTMPYVEMGQGTYTSISKSFSVAIASPARSCPHLHCWRAIHTQATPTSMMRCPATFAAAGLMFAFAKR